MQNATEILINGRQVTRQALGDSYEFVLNNELRVIDCVKIESRELGHLRPVPKGPLILNGLLFELQHVRVNPRQDNTSIIQCLIDAFASIGVSVQDSPKNDMLKVCFKPLGEISDKVRFYMNGEGKTIFLSPSTRPRLVSSINLQQQQN